MRNSQPIWIDAIRINQLDEREKISQIQLMCNIYRGATKVWAWIGNAVEATVEIISLTPRIISLRKDLQIRVTMEVVTKPEVLQLPPFTSPVWAALHNIVSSPWFDRLWILQEAALAGDISFLCGRHVIEWNVLWNIMDMSILLTQLATVSDTVNFGQPFKNPLAESNKSAFGVRKRVQAMCTAQQTNTGEAGNAIADIVQISSKQLCTEPRDRVLGILGFLSNDDRASLEIRPDMSTEELYVKFVHFLFQGDSLPACMSILGLVSSRPRDGSLPSWCPDFANNFGFRISDGYGKICHASSKIQRAQKSRKPSELILSGSKVDRVAAVVPGIWKPVFFDNGSFL
jgi:hypothetical protein